VSENKGEMHITISVFVLSEANEGSYCIATKKIKLIPFFLFAFIGFNPCFTI